MGLLWVPLVIVVLLAGGGLLLLQRGLLPRRRGNAPYCRRCGYNLTGLPSERCPECGGVIGPRGVVIGQRHRSPARAVAGLLCLLPPMMAAWGVWRGLDWYHYIPSRLLLFEIDRSSGRSGQRALSEVLRRLSSGQLAPADDVRLINLCLEQQRSSATHPVSRQLLRHLAARFERGVMSGEQEREYLRQYVSFDLRVRPEVVLGELVPWDYEVMFRGDSRRIKTVFVERETWLNDQPFQRLLPARETFDCSDDGSMNCPQGAFELDEPGRYRLIKVVEVQTLSRVSGRLLHSRREWLEASFEVLEQETGPVVSRSNPSLRRDLLERIDPVNFVCTMENYVTGQFWIRDLPVDVAFDVFARIGGREIRLGFISAERGRSFKIDGRIPRLGHWYTGPPVDRFDLILRSSERAARRSSRIVEFWEGELIYNDEPIDSYWFGRPYFRPRRDL